MLWLVTLLFWLLSLQLGQCFPQAHAHAGEHGTTSAATHAPLADDCEPEHHAHRQHTTTDVIHRSTRGTTDTTWSVVFLENTFTGLFRSPVHSSVHGSPGRDPCLTGRALLIKICVTRT